MKQFYSFLCFCLFLLYPLVAQTQLDQLQPVVIKGAKYPPRFKPDKGQSSEVLEKEEVESLQISNLQDVLIAIPGTSTIGGARKQAQVPQIRGLDNKKVVVLIDRTRLNFRSKHNGAFYFDPFLWKRVEVIKGPSSVLYGNGAVGGVLAIETKSAEDFLHGEEGWGGMIGGGHQSMNDEFQQVGALYSQKGSVDTLFAFSHRDSEDIRLGNGELLNYSGYKDQDLLFKFGYAINDHHHFKVAVDEYQLTSLSMLNPEDPGNNSSGDELKSQELIKRRQVSVAHDGQLFDRGESHLLLYMQDSELNKTRLSDKRFDKREIKTYGMDYYQLWKTGIGPHRELGRFMFGGEYYEDHNRGSRNGGQLGDFPKGVGKNEGLFVHYEHPILPQWMVIGGARYEAFQIRSDNALLPKRSGNNLSKKGGTQFYPIKNLKLFYNYSEGWNAPRLQEMFIDGTHFSMFGINFPFIPNLNLRPEHSYQHEVGLRYDGMALFFAHDAPFIQYNLFHERVKDYIDDAMNLETGATTYINLKDIRLVGHEMSVGYEVDRLSTKVSFTQIRGKDKITKKDFDKAPADEWKFQFDYRLIPQQLSLGYLGSLVYKQNRVPPVNETGITSDGQYAIYPTSGYMIHDSYINWMPMISKSEKVEIQFRVHNITDKAYKKHGSYMISPGRDFRLAMRYFF